jgi:hypothetical protein
MNEFLLHIGPPVAPDHSVYFVAAIGLVGVVLTAVLSYIATLVALRADQRKRAEERRSIAAALNHEIEMRARAAIIQVAALAARCDRSNDPVTHEHCGKVLLHCVPVRDGLTALKDRLWLKIESCDPKSLMKLTRRAGAIETLIRNLGQFCSNASAAMDGSGKAFHTNRFKTLCYATLRVLRATDDGIDVIAVGEINHLIELAKEAGVTKADIEVLTALRNNMEPPLAEVLKQAETDFITMFY